MNPIDPNAEWLEADGLGGFASGTVSGIRTRRYHAMLLTATKPPVGRMVLVNGFDAWVETPRGTFAISSQRYGADVVHPDGASRIQSFEYEPWPRWRYRIDNNLTRSNLMTAYLRSSCTRMVTTRTSRLGIAIFYMPKNKRVDLMPPKISRRRACLHFHFPKNRRC